MRVRVVVSWLGIVCGVGIGVALLLVASGRTGAAAATRARPADSYANETAVTMTDDAFAPQTVTVDPGTVVEWHNAGRNKHNVVPDDAGAGWRSGTIAAGKSFEHELATPGVYGYYCSFHGAPGRGMYGTVIVKNADGTLPAAVHNHRTGTTPPKQPRTIRVPKDEATIQSAVDRAAPGSLILVSPGVYREAVTVTTDQLVIRGLDRNRVILDGSYRLDNGVKVLGANGVAVENMSARHYRSNGFFWTGVQGYRGEYLTSTRTGDYGIYAFDSTDGIFRHDYASGSPDAGFYIGQCFPCNALISNVIAEYNGLGYSGTNAGGNLIITRSVWRKNRAGIVPNSGDGEKLAPQHGATVIGNTVTDNNNGRTPAIDSAKLAQGNGILVAGGNENLVTRNRVVDHDVAGIAIVPNPDTTLWISNRNRVEANAVSRSRTADLAAAGGDGNCFAGNVFATSKPSNIEQVMPCAGTPVPATDALDLQRYIDAHHPRSVDYRRAPTPRPPMLPGMRHPATARARPATGIVVNVDLASITLPPKPRR